MRTGGNGGLEGLLFLMGVEDEVDSWSGGSFGNSTTLSSLGFAASLVEGWIRLG